VKTSSDSRLGSAEAAREIGISTERLRYWERSGVVGPAYVRCGTRRFRRYSARDIERAALVKALVDDEKYSLEGAIRKLKHIGNHERPHADQT
jgi:DNA-binding transcriptional MerR regulator